jgi:hypothetical protein
MTDWFRREPDQIQFVQRACRIRLTFAPLRPFFSIAIPPTRRAAERQKPFLALLNTTRIIKLLTLQETNKGCSGVYYLRRRGWANQPT